MCGIAGILSPNGINKNLVYQITSKLEHRGPDNTGHWFADNNKVGLGHTRLSILDLSKKANQPMPSNDLKSIITFNGEIYNHLEMRKELNISFPKNILWKTNSDTETLVNYFNLFGIKKTLDKIVGMFAFAIWEIKSQKLTIARDRLGEKPLYYGLKNNKFFFSSELKSFKDSNLIDFSLNNNSISEYLKYGNIPGDLCIYKDINKLLPGHYCEILLDDMQSFKIKTYWDYRERYLESGSIKNNTLEDNVSEVKNLLAKSIKLQSVADVPMGVFLSGGIDSSLIAAISNDVLSNKINTFSIGYHEKQYDESGHAKKISKHLNTNHHELLISSNDLLNVIPNISDIYDEPFSDSSQIPTYLLCQFSKKKASVCLTGDGADELFGGYNRYIKANIFANTSNTKRNFYKFIFNSLNPELFNFLYNNLSFLLPKKYKTALPKEHFHKLSKILFINDHLKIYKNLISQLSEEDEYLNNDTQSELIDLYWNKNNCFKTFEDKMMAIDCQFYLPNDILTKVDRAAMFNSLETRCPYLDKNLVEFAMTINSKMKIDKNHNGKIILRKILSEYLPESYFDRPKMGFGVPIDVWLKGPLKEWAEDLLLGDKIKQDGIFNFQFIEKKWYEYLNNKGNWHHQLWSILIFQSWLIKQ